MCFTVIDIFDLYYRKEYAPTAMYRQHYNRGDIVTQTIDFFSLRKTNSPPICKLEQDSLDFINHPNSPLLLLGTYAILNQTVDISDAEFADFSFECFPKIYQQYAH